MNKMQQIPDMWSILPDALTKLKREYENYIDDTEKPDLTTAISNSPSLIRQSHQLLSDSISMNGNIAVMEIAGTILPKANVFSFFLGAATLDVMTLDFKTLMADEEVKAIVLDIESPGGVVFGVQEFANLVFEARASKPIFAISSSMMTSAAAWIASAADKIFITDEAVMTGSIGIVVEHVDMSKLEEKIGVKTTEITAGKHKRIESNVKPLTEEGRAELQQRVDHIYNAFVDDIAKFRGVSVATVLSNMADGKLFIGSQGIEAGLVDGFENLDNLVDGINTTGGKQVVIFEDDFERRDNMGVKAEDMTVQLLEKDFPAIYGEIFNKGMASRDQGNLTEITASYEKGKDKGLKEGAVVGAEAERERIQAVEKQLLPGQETLIETLKWDGKTSGPEAAVAMVQADKEGRATKLKTMVGESVDPVGNEVDPQTIGADNKTPKEKWDADPKLQADFKNNFAVYEAYERNAKAGNIRILNKERT